MRLFIILFLLFCNPVLICAKELQVRVAADSAVLIDTATNRVLYSRNSTKQQYPASLTKIAVCIYVLEKGADLLDTKLVADAEALKVVSEAERAKRNFMKCPSYWLDNETTRVNLKVGEAMPLRDLLYCLMLPSAGDAANVIAYNFGKGSIPHFMRDLNHYLQKIGCKNTHFCNPSGLHNPEHVSTAEDLVLLCQYAMKNPLFRQIVRTTVYRCAATNKHASRTIHQLNRLLRKGEFYYRYAVGIKTGNLAIAKRCIAAAAEKDGRLLIAILLKTEDRAEMFYDARALFEAAFSEKLETMTFIPNGHQEFNRDFFGAGSSLTTYTKQPLIYSYYPTENLHFRCELVWNTIELPIAKDAIVGELHLYADDKKVAVTSLYAETLVEQGLLGKGWDLLQTATSKPLSLSIIIGISILGFLAVKPRRRR